MSLKIADKLLVFGWLISEALPRRREFPQLVADHLSSHANWKILLAVMHHKLNADEVR